MSLFVNATPDQIAALQAQFAAVSGAPVQHQAQEQIPVVGNVPVMSGTIPSGRQQVNGFYGQGPNPNTSQNPYSWGLDEYGNVVATQPQYVMDVPRYRFP